MTMKSVFCRSDSLPSQTSRVADDVKTLATQLTRRGCRYLLRDYVDKPLVSLATKDTAPSEVVSDLLTAEEGRMQAVLTSVKERLTEIITVFCDALK